MCSLPFKNNRILISTSREALKILKCVSTSKGKAITAGGYFSEFSCMFPYCTIFSIELDSWALIGSTIGLKNTLKRHWFGFSSRYSFMKHEMTIWLFFLSWLDIPYLLYFLSPWWDWHFSMAFYILVKSLRISLWQLCSITIWRKWHSFGIGTVSSVVRFQAIDLS